MKNQFIFDLLTQNEDTKFPRNVGTSDATGYAPRSFPWGGTVADPVSIYNLGLILKIML